MRSRVFFSNLYNLAQRGIYSYICWIHHRKLPFPLSNIQTPSVSRTLQSTVIALSPTTPQINGVRTCFMSLLTHSFILSFFYPIYTGTYSDMGIVWAAEMSTRRGLPAMVTLGVPDLAHTTSLCQEHSDPSLPIYHILSCIMGTHVFVHIIHRIITPTYNVHP